MRVIKLSLKNPALHHFDVWLKDRLEHLTDCLELLMVANHQLVVPEYQVKIVQQESYPVSWLDLLSVKLGFLKLICVVCPLNF